MADTGLPLAFLAALQRAADKRQRISTAQLRAIEVQGQRPLLA